MIIWRSVVGKVWGTILILVSVVLFFLTMLLLQFFENFHTTQVEDQMEQIAAKVAEMVSQSPNSKKALSTATQIVDVYAARAVIIGGDEPYWLSPDTHHLPQISPKRLKSDPNLSRVLKEDKEVKIGDYTMDDSSERLVIVGKPIHYADGKKGAVYVYQSLEVIQHTTNDAKKIIYISAGIAIILTTIFAFFMSTRITAPLRAMREAVQQVAQGKFNTKVPILTNDEIGELGIAFNQMARQLKMNVTALNQEKEQLAGILSSMADGVMTFDKRGQLLITNPPAERFLMSWHYDQGDSEPIENPMFLKKVPQPIRKLFAKVVNEEKEQMTEITVQGRTWVILITPLYDDQSVIRGAVAVLRDMTEERHLDELRKGFIANVSHELRTPIALLQGYSEAIVDDVAGSEEEKREIAKIIYDESLRMGRLVNELLDLARLETGNFQLNKTSVMIGDFFSRVVGKFLGLAREEGIELKLEGLKLVEDELFMDPDRIEQVLTNLIDNAIRHTETGGTVTVSVDDSDEKVTVSVSDNGSGIAKEDLPFVFERFYKGDKARTRGKAGTGLGLAIAKNIVEAHQGEIMVQSMVGQGTTFSFYIPRKSKTKKQP
ncbi:MAG: ATP-binding protein [Tuberibacillus sp.]